MLNFFPKIFVCNLRRTASPGSKNFNSSLNLSTASLRLSRFFEQGVTGGMSGSNMDDLRVAYKKPTETLKSVEFSNPFDQFASWFEEACKKESGVIEPNAMCLSTSTPDGRPSSRYVLLKNFTANEGFVFYTNYNSRKGQEIESNPHVSVVFYWKPLHRSVRIEGGVQRTTEEESREYFLSRPKESQIAAIVSDQGQPISSRDELNQKYETFRTENERAAALLKPEHWGGYRITPDRFEFWQGQSNRLHDRIVYCKNHLGEWTTQRLQP